MTVDHDAMRVLHDQHAAVLWRAAVRVTDDHGRAHDAVQEVLLRAWQHPEVLDEARGGPRPWLMRTLRNVLVDQWRARSARPETLTDAPPDEGRDPARDDIDAALQSLLVGDALRRLSDEHRRVLVECYYRGRSVAEASATLGVPPGTVKSRTHYALKALRLVLDEMGVVT